MNRSVRFWDRLASTYDEETGKFELVYAQAVREMAPVLWLIVMGFNPVILDKELPAGNIVASSRRGTGGWRFLGWWKRIDRSPSPAGFG